MAGTINLFVDVQNQILVSGNGSQPGSATAQAPIPTLFENNLQPFTVQFLQPQPNPQAPFSILDVHGQNFRMSLGATPLAGNGSVTPLALQTAWTWNASAMRYEGTLALNTVGLDTYLGAKAQIQCTFELNLVDNTGAYATILQELLTLFAVLDSANTTTPTPTAIYLTAPQILATYFPRVGGAGDILTFTSPDGNWQRILGVDNTGTPFDTVNHT